MSGRTIAIGDVHGCAMALDALLRAIDPSRDDTLVFLGDYIDRGPDSRGVVESVIEASYEHRVVALQGNHEILLKAVLRGECELSFWLRSGGAATIASYGKSLDDIPFEHLRFLDECLPFHETDSHFFIHANYEPSLDVFQQPEEVAFWRHLTLMTPGPHCSGKIAVVGHTPQPSGEVLNLGHLVCIDTYCFGGRWLTAYDVTSGEIWQADRGGRLRDNAAAVRTAAADRPTLDER